MNIIDERPIHGLVSGVYYGQNARVDELNNRISARVQSDIPLTPNFDVRPVPTKYARFPLIDRMTLPKVGIRTPHEYSVRNNFASMLFKKPTKRFMFPNPLVIYTRCLWPPHLHKNNNLIPDFLNPIV